MLLGLFKLESEKLEELERKKRLNEEREETFLKLEGLRKKYKYGLDFKYLGLPAILTDMYIFMDRHIIINVRYLQNGIPTSMTFSPEEFEVLVCKR